MATPRILTSALLRTTFRSALPRGGTLRYQVPQIIAHSIPRSSFRQYSQGPTSKPSKIYSFEDISSLASHPPSSTPSPILLDVREPPELSSTGTIPGALNIPISSLPDSFHISSSEFLERFGFERPPKEAELVFFCKAGVRSRAAAEIARQAGWERVGEFPGSWGEWSQRGGKVERV